MILTEKEMCGMEVPFIKDLQKLMDYIKDLTDREHDYGTCVYAMSMAAVAAFNHVSSKLGCTGFQASCADLDILRRTRHMENGFSIVNYNNFLYPQYADNFDKVMSKDTFEQLQNAAKENIEKADIEYQEYKVKLTQYIKDIAAFVVKYPDYYDNRKHYDPLGIGTGEEWEKERIKKESGFEFAPQKPYEPINERSPVYKHWQLIVAGSVPFGFKLKDVDL